MKAFVIAIMLLGSQAHANLQTPFDTLREAYCDADTPAEVSDFSEDNWDRCLFSDINNPMVTFPTKVRTLELKSQDNGPLFPGDSNLRIDIFNDRGLDHNLYSFFQHSKVEETDTDLKQSLDGPPWRRMNIYGRRDSDKLYFFVEVSNHYGPYAPMYPQLFGYCWKDSPKESPEPIPPAPKSGY